MSRLPCSFPFSGILKGGHPGEYGNPGTDVTIGSMRVRNVKLPGGFHVKNVFRSGILHASHCLVNIVVSTTADKRRGSGSGGWCRYMCGGYWLRVPPVLGRLGCRRRRRLGMRTVL